MRAPFRTTLLFLAAFLCSLSASAQTTYSAVGDFSIQANPNGVWSYIDANVLLTQTGTGDGLSGWVTPIANFGNEAILQNISGATLNFGTGSNIAVVPTDHLYLSTAINNTTLRFTAPAAGSYAITGDFLGIDTEQISHNVGILVNGTSVSSGTLATYGQSISFAFVESLNAGDTVDFVNYGLPTITFGLATGLAANIAPFGPPSVAAAISASGFGGFSAIAPGTFIEIYGSNLAVDVRGWTGADFTGVNAPTMLDGTSVTIGGIPAFVNYISLNQVNVLVASNTPTGPQPLTLTTSMGTSLTYTVTVDSVEPGLLTAPSFDLNGLQYTVGLFVDGTFVLPTGAIAGLNSRPAVPGDVIVLYGIGFGPVTPEIPAGQLAEVASALTGTLQISIGGVPATVDYDGLAPGFTGLYQFNVTIPNIPANSAAPLTFSVNGTAGTQTLYLAIGN